MATVTTSHTVALENFPQGTVAGQFRLRIWPTNNPTAVREQLIDTGSAVFNDVPGGNWTVEDVRLDSNGNMLGSPVTNTFTVTEPTVQINVPLSVTVTVT